MKFEEVGLVFSMIDSIGDAVHASRSFESIVEAHYAASPYPQETPDKQQLEALREAAGDVIEKYGDAIQRIRERIAEIPETG